MSKTLSKKICAAFSVIIVTIFLTATAQAVIQDDSHSAALTANEQEKHSAAGEDAYREIGKPGKKCWIRDDVYFTYQFSEKPKLGMVVLKIQVFNKGGEKNSSFIIKGQNDMPAMRGAHDSGLQDFKLNNKNDYLLPLNIVMPGEWEVKLTFSRGEETIFLGSLHFRV